MTRKTSADKRNFCGERYGRLTAVKFADRDKWKASLWQFHCTCGRKDYVARIDQVRRGLIVSCGCHRRTVSGEGGRKRLYRHGHGRKNARSSEYASWLAMIARCRQATNDAYPNYGAKGIWVCKRWHDFQAFLADMGPKPTSRHTIGREDVKKNYEPSNCRWETSKEQGRNKSNTRWVQYLGRRVSLAEACDLADISRNVVDARLNRGWSIEKALATPVKRAA